MASNLPFRLFSSSDDKPTFGLGFFDSSQPPLPPPPPSTEVFPSKGSSSVEFIEETVNLDGLALVKDWNGSENLGEKLLEGFTLSPFGTCFKGRVSTKQVFGLPNSDLVPGVYEGGLKLWEGSLDLVKALRSEIQNAHISFAGKRVLELGCGHGLPGIFACLEGAVTIHFQDFNAEVLECLTIPNVNANLAKKSMPDSAPEVRYFAGEWSKIHELLPYADRTDKDLSCSSGCDEVSGYDVILMAETIYSVAAQQNLYALIKKCINHPHGVVYMAGKKHYFGVGGGTRQFLSILEKDGLLASELVAEVTDGSSNVREVWKLSCK